jgi:hypothetical protein
MLLMSMAKYSHVSTVVFTLDMLRDDWIKQYKEIQEFPDKMGRKAWVSR